MTTPTRVLHTGPDAYVMDPYVRDGVGRFAPKPTVPLPPLEVLERQAESVQVLANGSTIVSRDTAAGNYWKVRCVREEDGTYRVIYLNEE